MSPRRVPIALLTLLSTAACGDGMSPDAARQAVVVNVNGTTLDGATFEELLLKAPPQFPPSLQSAAVFTSAFVDAALLRRAIVRAEPLADSAMVSEAITADAIRGTVLEALQARAARMPPVTDEQADSVSRLGAVRVFQDLYVQVPPNPDSAQRLAAVRRMQGLEEQVRNGGDFTALVQRASEDTAAARTGGFMPALTRDDLGESRMASAAWRLQPGETTDVITAPNGYHIFRRATVAESRPGVRQWLMPRLAERMDSAWVDSLVAARKLTVASDALARMRALVVEPYSGGGTAPLATWEGGDLAPDEARMWLMVRPSVDRATLPTAPDTALVMLVRQLAQRELAWEEAAPGAPRVSPRAWEALAPLYRQALAEVTTFYRPVLTNGDSLTAVRNYMLQVIGGKMPYRPLPGALGWILRRDAEVTINQAAIEALVNAAADKWRPDTTAPAPAARPDSQ